MDESLTISIDILQRPYCVRVNKQDEEIFRQASQEIESLIQKYTTKSGVYRDKQDLLAMALLESTVMILKDKVKDKNLEESRILIDRLNSVDELLSSQLEKIE
ncbi:MAG: cell division protein ZapA [Bacteroidales bacterium]